MMLKESTKKKKARQLAQKSKDNNDSDDVIITIPETLLDLQDDGFILIPVSVFNTHVIDTVIIGSWGAVLPLTNLCPQYEGTTIL